MKVDKCKLLQTSKTIAVVGISRFPRKVSREIAGYLVRSGYKVVGVNPDESFKDADGIVVYNSLKEIPFRIDIVNVFRKSEDIPSIIEDVISIKPRSLWLQLGIKNDEAVHVVSKKGIEVIQDLCIKIEHSICM